jgi:hypothetical protein
MTMSQAVGKHYFDFGRVGRVHDCARAQVPLARRGFRRQNVTCEGVVAYDLATASHFEPFGRTLVRFHFRHRFRLSVEIGKMADI